MKVSAIRKLRQKLAADQAVLGLWVTLESASVTEMAVALGLDWVVIDAEHGHLDWHNILEHLRATVRSDTTALVRVTELNIGQIKRALDIGADGVVVPWIETADQLRQAVAFAHYPPDGLRGMGGERATCWGRCLAEHAAEADEHVLVVPIIETVRAGQNIEELCRVDGVELFQFGPADYSSTAGFKGQWEGPGVAQQLLAIKDTIRRQGKNCGVLATSNENLIERRAQGFRFLGVGMDAGLLLRSVTGALTEMGRSTSISTSLAPESGLPLRAVAAPIQPDRAKP
jgi:2-keto-3-deoxy-L-rhamnonate aldolase RhmA